MKALFALDLEKTLKRALEVALERDLTFEDPVLQGLIRFLATRLEEARKILGRLPEKSLFHLFHLLGVSAPSPRPARTVVVFSVAEKAEEPLVLRKGFPVSKDEIIFETQEEALLLPGRLEKVLFYAPEDHFLAEASPDNPEEISPWDLSPTKGFQVKARFPKSLLCPGEKFTLLFEKTPKKFSLFVEGQNGKRPLARKEHGYFEIDQDLKPFEDEKGAYYWLGIEGTSPFPSRFLFLWPGKARVEHLFCADRPLLKEHFFFPLFAEKATLSPWMTFSPWIRSFFLREEEHFWLKNPFGQPPLPGTILWLGGFWLLPGTRWTMETYGSDLSLKHLSFEYFDGKRWKAIKSENGSFSFPEDLSPTTVNQVFSRWLKIRYVGPIKLPSEGSASSKDYFLRVSVFPAKKAFEPERLFVSSLGEEFFSLPQQAPEHGLLKEEVALYLPLKKAFSGGPVSLYFSGKGRAKLLKRLEISTSSGFKLLSWEDTTNGLQSPGFLRFYLPQETSKRKLFGEERFWLRLVLEKEGAQDLLFKGLYLNALSAREGESLQYLFQASGLPRETISLRPLVGEIEVLVDGRSYAVVDDLSLWGPEDEVVELDPERGLLVFGDGHQGKVPPSRATIEIRYVSHHGETGNLPAQSLKDLPEPLPFLEEVEQPEPAAGGRSQTEPTVLLARLPAKMRHRQRAVTAQDLADLLRELDEIRGLYFEVQEERLRLYLLPYAQDPAPRLSQALRQIVTQRLKEALPLTLAEFEIKDPLYIPINLRAKLLVFSGVTVQRALSRAREALFRFLHPVSGNFEAQGFPFGKLPLLSDFYRLLQELPEIRAVQELEVVAVVKGEERPYQEGLPPKLPGYVLPTAGEIHLRGEGNET